MSYEKVRGEHNPADCMTKYVSKEIQDRHAQTMGERFASGRAAVGLEVQAGAAETGAGRVT